MSFKCLQLQYLSQEHKKKKSLSYKKGGTTPEYKNFHPLYSKVSGVLGKKMYGIISIMLSCNEQFK
jgi:hypothetical protein